MNKGYVYLMLLQDLSACKIGRSITPKDRLYSLSKDFTFNFEESYLIECNVEDMIFLEKILQNHFHRYNKKDIPRFNGYTEFFDIECIKKTLSFISYIEFDVKVKKGVCKKHLPHKSNVKTISHSKNHAAATFRFLHSFIYSYKNHFINVKKLSNCYKIYVPSKDIRKHSLQRLKYFFKVKLKTLDNTSFEIFEIEISLHGSKNYKDLITPIFKKLDDLISS